MKLQEDYCSFETSKLLKEKGFDEPCLMTYDIITHEMRTFSHCGNYGLISNLISCPTLQMAMKWLRCMGIYIEIDVLGKTNIKYGFTILKLNDGEIYSDDKTYTTYEEAVEAAIKYTLENLI